MGFRALACGAAMAFAAASGLVATAGCIVEEPASDAMSGDEDSLLRLQPAFAALDADDDGEISAGEIDAAPAVLAALDGDGDGRLAGDELRPGGRGPIGGPARAPAEATAAFMAFDGDGNGTLEGAELPSTFRSLVTRADADGDEAATEAEILALLTSEAAGPPDGEGDGTAAREGGEPAPPAPLMAALDADRDGTVSATEIVAAPRSLRALDGDGDGRLTTAELRPAADGEADGGA